MMKMCDATNVHNGVALYMAENAYLNDTALDVLKMVATWLEEAPIVDAVEVVHGRWIKTNKYDEDSSVQCSKCLMEFDYIDGVCYLVTGSELPHYCPNCGAKMDGDGHEQRTTTQMYSLRKSV